MENKNLEKFALSLDNYISDAYSLCREERQYALFLSNILKKYRTVQARQEEAVKDIFKICGIPADAEVLDVFYEATFMRDIFTRNRKKGELIYRINHQKNNEKKNTVDDAIISDDYCITKKDYQFQEGEQAAGIQYTSFNKKLINFLQEIDIETGKKIEAGEGLTLGEKDTIPEKNIGHHTVIYEDWLVAKLGKTDKEDLDDDCKRRVKMAKYMMNSKPDIAVIYKQDGKIFLRFLECKFESNEDKFDYGITQTKIQTLIAEFICADEEYGRYQNREAKESGENIELRETRENKANGGCIIDKLTAEKSIKVEFTRAEKNIAKSQGKIPIQELIQWNQKIFKNGEEQ